MISMGTRMRWIFLMLGKGSQQKVLVNEGLKTRRPARESLVRDVEFDGMKFDNLRFIYPKMLVPFQTHLKPRASGE